MELRDILLEYKDATLKFINAVDNDLEEAEKFIALREDGINKLKLIGFDKVEFREISGELGLIALEEEALRLITLEKTKVNVEIIDLKKSRQAGQVYNNSFQNINFVNKRI